jgi:phosphocarrier protein
MAEPIVRRELTITNALGLHARPAAMFVQLASKFASEITVERGGERVNGKSIMGIMMLAAGKGLKITVTAEGYDAEDAVNALEELVSNGFGED